METESHPSSDEPPQSPPLASESWTGLSPQTLARFSFFLATFAAQCANNALFVMLPLVILRLSASEAALGFVAGLSTAMDAGGTVVGGYLLRHLSERNLLLCSMVTRAGTLLGVPLLLASDRLSLGLATTFYCVDAVARGCADTARNTIPMSLAGREPTSLRRFNAVYQIVFETGGIAGPILVGAILYASGITYGNWMVVAAFLLSGMALLAVPSASDVEAAPRIAKQRQRNQPDGHLSWYIAGLLLLTIYPLKQILPALFATSILQDERSTAWLVACFGIGGTLGAILFHRLHGFASTRAWLLGGAVGACVLAIGWLPAALLPMGAAMLTFAGLNMMARLALVSDLQANIPPGREGNVIGLLRFSTNLTSMGLKFFVGTLFAFASVAHAFGWLTVLLFSLGLGTMLVVWRLGVAERDALAETSLLPALSGAGLASAGHEECSEPPP